MCPNVAAAGLLLITLVAVPGCGRDAETQGETEAASVPAPAEASAPAGAQQRQNPVRAELENYRLSIEDVRRWVQANVGLNRFAAANPEVVAALEEGRRNLTAAQSVTALEERIERVPQARTIVDSAGLTPHSYALITLVLVQVQRAETAARQGMDLDRVARELGVSRENIQFVREHQAEITQLRRDAEAASN